MTAVNSVIPSIRYSADTHFQLLFEGSLSILVGKKKKKKQHRSLRGLGKSLQASISAARFHATTGEE